MLQPHVYLTHRHPFFCFPPKQFVEEQQSGFSSRENKEPVPFRGLCFCQPAAARQQKWRGFCNRRTLD